MSDKTDPIVGKKFSYEFDHRKYHGHIKAHISGHSYLVATEVGDRIMTLADMQHLQFIFSE